MSLRRALALLVLLPGLPPCDAVCDTRLGAGRAVVDEVVADTATIAPVRAAIPFRDFRYPHVDEAENVTFIADDPFFIGDEAARQTHGIYRSSAATGEIRCLVGPETDLPGGGRPSWIRGLQSDGSSFVFHARVRLDEGGAADALYRWSESSGFSLLARQSAPAPGGGTYERIGYAALDDARVAYTALDSLGRTGLFLADLETGRAVRLARGGGEEPFQLFWFQPWITDGIIAFGALDAAGREGLWFAPAPTLEKPAANGPVFAPGRLDLSTLPVPPEVELNFVESTPTSQGWLAFTAGRATDPDRHGYGGAMLARRHTYKGVFLVRDDRAINIVDTETFIPGHDSTFTNFSFWTACQRGRVVFVARGEGFVGVYLYDVASATLYEVATSDGLIDGRKPTDFEVGARPLVGERCAFTARFKGDKEITGGVYLATLRPAPAQTLRRK